MGVRFHVGDTVQIERFQKAVGAMGHASGMKLEARRRLVQEAGQLARALLRASAGGGTLLLCPLRKDESVGVEVSVEGGTAVPEPQSHVTVWDPR